MKEREELIYKLFHNWLIKNNYKEGKMEINHYGFIVYDNNISCSFN